MQGPRMFDRREFTVASALAMLSGVVITMSGCGSSNSPNSPTPEPTPAPGGASDKTGTIGSNHGHSAVITGAQLAAGGALTLNIQGSASHPHTVTLTSAELTSIAGNQRVSKESSSDSSHSHTVTFN